MVLIIITLSFVAKDAADKPANNSKFPKKQGNLLSFLGKSIANPRKRPLSPLPFDSAKKPKSNPRCVPSREPCICLTCFK